MSDRMTSITLRSSQGSGWAEWGSKTVPEMIAAAREHALWNKKWAEEVLAASDEDFHVETYLGVRVHKNREVLQEGKKKL